MSIVTDRPNATVSNSGCTVTGAGGVLDAALADNSDASYVSADDGDAFVVGFSEPSLPAGAVIKEVRLRVRVAKLSGGSDADPQLTAKADGVSSSTATFWVGSATPTTVTSVYAVAFAGLDPISYEGTYLGGASGSSRVYELYADTTYVAKPTLNVTTPTGTITDDTTPPPTWTRVLDSGGGAQTRYHVKIFSAAQYGAGGFDPATSTATLDSADTASAALTHTFSTPLAEGTFRSYVRIAQTVNGVKHWSDWDYSEFTIAVLRPDPPVSVTVTGEDDEARNYIEVITTNAGDATVDLVEVEFSHDGGTTWEHLRTVLGGGLVEVAFNAAEAWDSEAPNGEEVTYRARTLHDNGDGTYAMSVWVEAAAAASWTGADYWLKHPTMPELNMTFRPQSQPSQTRAARRGVFQPLGRADAIVTSDVRRAAEGEWVFLTYDEAERDALDALLETGSALLVQAPDGALWDDAWLSFGDHERRRGVDASWAQTMFEALSWNEVARPTDNLIAWPD